MINDCTLVRSFAVNRFCHALLCIAMIAAAMFARTAPAQPFEGDPGKDVVWIASPHDMVEKMLDMARVTPQDYVIDLGSGDGRNVIAAAKRGARALGVEYNPALVEVSRRAAAAAGVADRATFVQGDMFEADISQATVLILFLIPDNLRRLDAKFRAMKSGTRIVSNTYEIASWYGEETSRTTPCPSWCVATLYVVPADVAGVWRWPDGELTLEQDLQLVFGTYETSGLAVRIEGGRLRGDEIRFAVNGVVYEGRVENDTMTGIARSRSTHEWRATRAP
jgi:SAM-dependent methyltransferase